MACCAERAGDWPGGSTCQAHGLPRTGGPPQAQACCVPRAAVQGGGASSCAEQTPSLGVDSRDWAGPGGYRTGGQGDRGTLKHAAPRALAESHTQKHSQLDLTPIKRPECPSEGPLDIPPESRAQGVLCFCGHTPRTHVSPGAGSSSFRLRGPLSGPFCVLSFHREKQGPFQLPVREGSSPQHQRGQSRRALAALGE